MCHVCGDSLTPYSACCAPEPPEECPRCGCDVLVDGDNWFCSECPWPTDEPTDAELKEQAELEKWEERRGK